MQLSQTPCRLPPQTARHPDAVAAAVVLERHVQRLAHVADPVAEEPQRVEPLLWLRANHNFWFEAG
jgi:hypothetical protein